MHTDAYKCMQMRIDAYRRAHRGIFLVTFLLLLLLLLLLLWLLQFLLLRAFVRAKITNLLPQCVIMHVDACRHTLCEQMRTNVHTSESDSVASVVSPASRMRLSQNCGPPAEVCSYACRCMPTHIGLLTSSSASSLSLSLSPVAGGLRGVCSCCRCITVTISTAASIQMHTNAHTCIPMLTPFPLCSCFFILMALCAGAGAGGLRGLS